MVARRWLGAAGNLTRSWPGALERAGARLAPQGRSAEQLGAHLSCSLPDVRVGDGVGRRKVGPQAPLARVVTAMFQSPWSARLQVAPGNGGCRNCPKMCDYQRNRQHPVPHARVGMSSGFLLHERPKGPWHDCLPLLSLLCPVGLWDAHLLAPVRA